MNATTPIKLAEIRKALGISRQATTKWRGVIPEERCKELERIDPTRFRCEELRPDVQWLRAPDGSLTGHVVPATSGAVTPHELRPDLYPDPDYRPALPAAAGIEAKAA